MKTLKIAFTVLLLSLAGAGVAQAAHGHGGHGGHGGRVHFGVVIGAPYWNSWYFPGYYYPPYYAPYSPYYYPPAIERTPPVYVEQQPAPANDWYYCRATKAYYPYVRTCPEGWLRVPAQP